MSDSIRPGIAAAAAAIGLAFGGEAAIGAPATVPAKTIAAPPEDVVAGIMDMPDPRDLGVRSATALLPIVLFPLAGVLSIRDAAAPYAHEYIFLFMGGFMLALAMERWKPATVWRDLRRGLNSFVSLQKQLPLRLSQIIEKIDRGELNIRFQHENLGGIRNTLENITNRLTFGIIIAALIIGSSMIITTGVEPLLFGFPALGIIGYVVSGVLGLWLIFNIIRSRKF